MKRVHFTFTPWPGLHAWEGSSYVAEVTRQLLLSRDRSYEPTSDPADADLIVYLEGNFLKTRAYAECLLKDPLVRDYPDRTFMFGYDDYAVGLLPGLYVDKNGAMEHDPRFRTWCYLLPPNGAIEAAYLQRSKPVRLAAFRGGRTASVRNELFARAESLGPRFSILNPCQDGFYRHTADQQRLYAEELASAAFGICPRGLGRNTHRFWEVMQCGRVPVVLADGWTPPKGPDWESFSVFVAESDVGKLPEIIARFEPQAEEMGLRARAAWERYFSPGTRVAGMLRQIEEIAASRPSGAETAARSSWRSEWFWHRQGLGRWHALVRRLRRAFSG